MTDSWMQDPANQFGAADDRLHEAAADFYFTETFWFSFFVPEKTIGGWLYSSVRPNAGVSAGGCWIWDETATDPWAIPFYEQFSHLKLPTQSGPKLMCPTGTTIITNEPGMVYDLEHGDRDRLSVRARFDGLERPVPLRTGEPPYPRARHFDQTGRVTGHLVLDGERIDIDCYAMRDRTWGTRKERGYAPVGYTWLAGAERSLLAYSLPGADGTDQIHSGYLRTDGRLANISSGRRTVRRDTDHGWVTGIELTALDVSGRETRAVGTVLSRMVLPAATSICVNSLMSWQVEGVQIYGEDQDVWPIHKWRRLTRPH